MKVYNSHDIKNIALLGNDRSGKTTLTECLLYHAGALQRRGRITQKNTVSDYFPVEQEYGYSVFSTASATPRNSVSRSSSSSINSTMKTAIMS